MAQTVNKQELIKRVSELTGETKAVVEKVVEGVLHTLEDAVSKLEKVDIRGHLKLEPIQKEAYTARNPKDGSPVHVPAKVKVKATAGSKLQDAANA
jgi:DNA-binding protein HU-beta